MKNTVKKFASVLIAVMMLFSASAIAFAETNQQSGEATVRRSFPDFFSGTVSSQASDVLSVTSTLTLNSAAPDPTGYIIVKVSNCSGNSYRVNWSYATGSSRVVDPPEIVDSSFSSGTAMWKIAVTAVQKGTTSIPFTVTNNTLGTTVGTMYCNITVTAPTLTVTPSNIVIDLNYSNSVTLDAVVSNFSGTDTIDIGFGTSSSRLNCEYGDYLNNGTELIVSSNTAGTYYLYVGLRNPSTGYDILTQTYTVTVRAKTEPVTLTGIGIYSRPDTISYMAGESLDITGLKIRAYYSDGTSQIISSGFTCSSPDMSTPGVKTVNVYYGGKSTSFNVTVVRPAPAEVKATSVEIYVIRDFGDTNEAQLGAVVNPSNATYNRISWTSSNTTVATVDSDGTVRTYDVVGVADIKVTVINNDGTTVTDTVTVTVTEEDINGGGTNEEPQSIWASILQIIMAIIDFLLLPITIFF